jgi:putative spermidine/putrescine transport system permease protein
MTPKGGMLLALPLALAQIAFFLAPLLILAATSFATDERLRAASLDAWTDFATDSFNLMALVNTVKLGAYTVCATALLAFPLALVHQIAGPRLRRVILIATILPMLTSVVVRSFAWIAILGREGMVSQAMLALGVTSVPTALLQTEPGLVIALTQIEMPLMLLPLLSTLGRLDPALLDASAGLGASLARTLRKVVLPAALPGLVAGASLVFASSSTAFISQSIIGGGRLVYLPALLWQQAMIIFNWPLAAVISLTMMAAVLAVVWALNAAGRRAYG